MLIQEKSRKCVISSQHAKFSLSFNWHGILVLWLYKEDLKILSVIRIRLLDFLDEMKLFSSTFVSHDLVGYPIHGQF